MSLTGLSEREATERLNIRAVISAGTGSAAALRADISELLERTIHIVPGDEHCDIELAVGCIPLTTAPVRLTLAITNEELAIRTVPLAGEPVGTPSIPGLTRKIAACYAAGYLLTLAIGGSLLNGAPDPFIVVFEKLGLPLEGPWPITLNDAVLVGAGGIANGFLWAAEELSLTGRLIIVDPKKVGSGNLNRCLFFSQQDVGLNKSEVLAAKFQSPGLKVESFVGTFKAFRQGRPDGRVKRAITTVDSRRARRSIQNELPAEVLDASTTDISEIIVHSHRQPNPNACLSCIYAHIPQEDQREQDIADGLGISIAEVQQGFIDQPLAVKLATLHPELDKDALIGTALDSLFKRKCGEGTLMTAAGKQAAAPFAFISNLAGALLALELIRFDSPNPVGQDENYLALSPWRPPHKLIRRTRKKLPSCEFCSKPESEQVMRMIWPELDWM